MKAKNKILLTSFTTIALSASLIAGSTFALFTSESTTNIAVTAGKVNVTASAELVSAWSAEWDGNEYVSNSNDDYVIKTGDGYKFYNGGLATEKGGVVSLNQITPGDGVQVKVNITNNSNVAIQYRVSVTGAKDTGLFGGLDVTYYADQEGTEAVSTGWTTVAAEAPIDPIYLNIELPCLQENQNKYQGKSCDVVVTVEAVQSNANTADIEKPADVVIADTTELAAFAQRVNDQEDFSGQTIVLGADIDLAEVEWAPIGSKEDKIYFNGTFDGAGHTISGLSIDKEGDFYVALFGAVENATIKNVTVEGSVKGENAAGLIGRVIGNTVIENCVNKATVDGSVKAGGLVCNITDAELVQFINCTNEGNVITTGNAGAGGLIGYVNNNVTVEIINCANEGDISGDKAGAAVGWAASSHGSIVNMTNTGTITTNPYDDGRYLKNEEEGFFLCGYVATIGNWTYVNAEMIATEEALIDFAAKVNSGETTGSYLLMDDITLTSEWTPIGTSSNAFNGTFDGNGHTISNVTVESDSDYVGLFGVVDVNATVKNVELKNVSVIGAGAVGAVVGWGKTDWKGNAAVIEDVTITGTFKVQGTKWVGGIVGYQVCSVKNCTIDVIADEAGNIIGSGQYVGGIMGQVEDGRPATLEFSGNTLRNVVISGAAGVGAILGLTQGNVILSNNTLTNVKISGTSYIGALIGQVLGGNNAAANLTISDNKGDVTVVTSAAKVDDGIHGTVSKNYEIQKSDNELVVTWNS